MTPAQDGGESPWGAPEWVTVGLIAVSLAVALVLLIVTAGPRTVRGAAVAAPAPPLPAQPTQASLIPPQVPNWQAAVSTRRNAALDVPPTWRVEGPGWVFGYGIPELDVRIAFDGGARYSNALCPGDQSAKHSAIAGIAGSPITDLTAAATDSARLWAFGMFGDDTTPLPVIALSDPVPSTVNSRPAVRVTATVNRTSCSDGRGGVVHALALPGNRGQPIVFIVGAEQGMPGAATDADLQKMLTSARAAGLTPAQCDQGNVVGTWC
ncbi:MULTISPECIES: hypothetical protein [Nocardia]|uniref:hypothetical protein n=1 Tax=Nocardia TaxID=1817 RepID=UPI0013005B0E|nr:MULTISPECIES: hypothetical protein [Nocardia]